MHSPTWVCLLFVLGFPFRAWEVAGVEFLQPLHLHFSGELSCFTYCIMFNHYTCTSQCSTGYGPYALKRPLQNLLSFCAFFGHPTFSSPSSHTLDPIFCTHLVVLKATKWQLILAIFNQPILRKLPLNFGICDPHCSLSFDPISCKLRDRFCDIYCYGHTNL